MTMPLGEASLLLMSKGKNKLATQSSVLYCRMAGKLGVTRHTENNVIRYQLINKANSVYLSRKLCVVVSQLENLFSAVTLIRFSVCSFI